MQQGTSVDQMGQWPENRIVAWVNQKIRAQCYDGAVSALRAALGDPKTDPADLHIALGTVTRLLVNPELPAAVTNNISSCLKEAPICPTAFAIVLKAALDPTWSTEHVRDLLLSRDLGPVLASTPRDQSDSSLHKLIQKYFLALINDPSLSLRLFHFFPDPGPTFPAEIFSHQLINGCVFFIEHQLALPPFLGDPVTRIRPVWRSLFPALAARGEYETMQRLTRAVSLVLNKAGCPPSYAKSLSVATEITLPQSEIFPRRPQLG